MNITLEPEKEKTSSSATIPTSAAPPYPPKDNIFRIFLSHKAEDARIAETIKEELELGSDRLDVFLSEGIPFGDEWDKKIKDALRQSDWLFLLYGRPSANWDWCLYEAGFFAAAESSRRLVCLYSAGTEPPGPLRKWQGVPAKTKDWVKLLAQVYGDQPRQQIEPLNRKLAGNGKALEGIANKILQEVGREPTREYYNGYLNFVLDDQQCRLVKERGGVPAEALVQCDHEPTLQIFGLKVRRDRCWTWKDLTEKLSGPAQTSWISALSTAARQAVRCRDFSAALPIFESADSGNFRPVLHRLDRLANGGAQLMVTLIKVPKEADPLPPGELGRIYILLRMARIFRWGLLAKYYRELNALKLRGATAEQIEACLDELDRSIQGLELEGARLDLYDVSALKAAFADDLDKKRLDEMFRTWGELREALNQKRQVPDIDGILEIFDQMRGMNKEFLLMGARQSMKLIEELP